MDADRFDSLARALSSIRTRRGLLGPFTALTFAGVLVEDADAAGRRKRRKKRHKHQPGDDKRRHKGQEKGHKKDECASDGQSRQHGRPCCVGLGEDAGGVCVPPADCVPTSCPPTACGPQPDGCGGTLTCSCGTDQLCIESVCRACTVTCAPGDAVACGTALQTALDDPGLATLVVCPGIYQGGFAITRPGAVTVIGAGDGDDDALDTILDGNNAVRVLDIGHTVNAIGPVELAHLRLRNGRSPVAGAGIYLQGTTLRLRDSTVTGNTSTDNDGGGIFVVDEEPTPPGVLVAERCTISHNRATSPFRGGGGIGASGPVTLTDCLVEANEAGGRGGGGIYVGGGTTLAGETVVRDNQTVSRGGGIFVDRGTLNVGAECRITGNDATDQGGGIFNDAGGTVNLAAGAAVCENEAPNDPQCNFDDPACEEICPPA